MKEISQCPLSANSVADQHGQKVRRFMAAETASHQLDADRAKASSSPFCVRCWDRMTTSANHAGTEGRSTGEV